MRIASNQALNVRGQLTTGATNDDPENRVCKYTVRSLVVHQYELQVLRCLEDMLLLFPAKKYVRGKWMHKVCLQKEELPQELSSSGKKHWNAGSSSTGTGRVKPLSLLPGASAAESF